jgi:hypothetical protein
MTNWLILVHRIPPKPLYLRAKMRQRLEAVGAVAVKNSVYLLPQGPEALEDLQWIAQEIVAGGGDAHLITGEFVDRAASDDAVARFRERSDAAWAELAEEARAAGSAAGAAESAAVHARLSRRFDEIRRTDFFDSPQRRHAEKALASLEGRMKRGQKEDTNMKKAHPELRGRRWVTRPDPHVDRLASAWFIRRYVDPKARFGFADPKSPKRDGELRFDMVGGDFTHEGDRCTLETLVRRVGLPDKGTRAIAEIVHDLDLKDGKYGRPETAGVRAMLDGLIAREADDDARVERAMQIFDDLHEALSSRARKRAP